MGMFEKAARLKLRFKTPMGNLTAEDLWDLPLKEGQANLNDLAKALSRAVKEAEEGDFVDPVEMIDPKLELRFEIVKHVINVRILERNKAEELEVARQKKQQIMAIIAEKEAESLKESSLDELKALLESL